MNSMSNEWYTPAVYVQNARTTMGGIDLDPASCNYAQRTVQAAKYYTSTTNGLTKQWHGRVWLNPPFTPTTSNQGAKHFALKLLEEYKAGRVDQAVMLLPTQRAERAWFKPFFNFTLCILHKRIKFYNKQGTMQSPKFGCMFIYLGENIERFNTNYNQHGAIMERYPLMPELNPVKQAILHTISNNSALTHNELIFELQKQKLRRITLSDLIRILDRTNTQGLTLGTNKRVQGRMLPAVTLTTRINTSRSNQTTYHGTAPET